MIGTCKTDGCSTSARSSGFCPRCYNRLWQRAKATADGTHLHGAHPALTDEQVAEARKMLVGFRTRREVAAHFGVSVPTLRRALTREDES